MIASVWSLFVRWVTVGEIPLWAWSSLFGGVIETALWPLAVLALLAPQRRPTDIDPNRPI